MLPGFNFHRIEAGRGKPTVSYDTALCSFLKVGSGYTMRTELTPIDHPTHAGNDSGDVAGWTKCTIVSDDAIARVDGYKVLCV